MMESYHYYNIFSPEGRLLQVEYALEAVNSSSPIVIARNKEAIVFASKKPYSSKLMDEEPKNVFKVSSKIHLLITGLEGDIDQVVLNSSSLCSNKERNMGLEITPDILCRAFSDKIQNLIQSTGQRTFAFGAMFFGFDFDGPSIYVTDTSAVFYPYFGYAFGEKSGKMNKFLEVNLNQNITGKGLEEVVVQSLLESIGDETPLDKIEVGVLEENKEIVYLDSTEKEALSQRISDR